MIKITPFLEKKNKIPLYVQLYKYIKNEIEQGNLPSEALLPSIRQLSDYLQISKNTVEGAYQQLIAEGYVESIPRVGLRILSLEEPTVFFAQIEQTHSEASEVLDRIRGNQQKADKYLRYDFVYGHIDTEHFPMKIWKKSLLESMSDDSDKALMYGDPFGDRSLRKELSYYLLQSRGFTCDPDQIVITSGTQHATSLLCQLLSLHGSSVAIEEPGYDGVRMVLVNQGCSITPISLDVDGISLSNLQSSNAKLVYLTPSHQLPYGMILPIQKRLMLLNWAYENDSYILEDDYDSEFRYQGQPIPALKALDKKERVIYLGTFSKCFLPALRVSYLVLPPKLVQIYKEKLHNYNQASSPIIQRALYLFMKSGDFERHIRRMKIVYQHKHKILLQSIEKFLGDRVEVIGEKSGLHILLHVHGKKDEELIEQAMEYGVKVYSTLKFWHHPSNHIPSVIMLGFGRLTEQEIVEAIQLLKKAWFPI